MLAKRSKKRIVKRPKSTVEAAPMRVRGNSFLEYRASLAELMEIVENFGIEFGMDVDKYIKEEPETN